MNQLSIDQEPTKKTNTLFILNFFFVVGVSALSGWNCILVGMDYFNLQFVDMWAEFYFPIPNYFAMSILGVMMPKLSNFVSLQIRIVLSLIMLSILIVLLPIVAKLLPNKEGFYVDLLISTLIGVFSCFVQSSGSGLASMYGPEYIATFYIGLGTSGIFICSFQFVSLSAIPSAEISIFITLIISALLNIIAIIMFFIFKSTPMYKRGEIMKKSGHSVFDQDNEVSLIQSQTVVKLQKMGFLETFWHINKIAFPIPFLILILYIQTFMIFPAVTLQKKFTEEFQGWGIAIIIQCFNVGDTLGMVIASYRYYSQTCLTIFLFLRFILFYPFILIAFDIIKDDYVAYINCFVFAFTHGYINTGVMQLGPQKSNVVYIKEKIGFVNACSLYFGITIGCIMAPILKTYYLH